MKTLWSFAVYTIWRGQHTTKMAHWESPSHRCLQIPRRRPCTAEVRAWAWAEAWAEA